MRRAVQLLRRTAPYLGACLAIHGFSSAMEGTMLGSRDEKILGMVLHNRQVEV